MKFDNEEWMKAILGCFTNYTVRSPDPAIDGFKIVFKDERGFVPKKKSQKKSENPPSAKHTMLEKLSKKWDSDWEKKEWAPSRGRRDRDRPGEHQEKRDSNRRDFHGGKRDAYQDRRDDRRDWRDGRQDSNRDRRDDRRDRSQRDERLDRKDERRGHWERNQDHHNSFG